MVQKPLLYFSSEMSDKLKPAKKEPERHQNRFGSFFVLLICYDKFGENIKNDAPQRKRLHEDKLGADKPDLVGLNIPACRQEEDYDYYGVTLNK